MKKTKPFISLIIASFLTIICFAGCQAKFSSLKPVLDQEGEVFVYVQPVPQEAERLKFNLEGISALRQDGTEIPLSLLFNKFEAPDVRRQRLVASGILPPGIYRGLSFKAASAVLTTEEEEAATLLIPEKPVIVDFSFTITRKKASVLMMNFLYQQSVSGGFNFSPQFSLYHPSKPVTGLLGYVSNTRSNTITVFDKKAGQVVSVLATGRAPKGIAIDQARSRAYIALSGEDAVEAIDMTTGDSLSTIRLREGAAPQHLALTPDGRLLMSVNPGLNSVSFIDPLSYLELTQTTVGDSPSSVLLDPTARRAYVFNVMSNNVSVVDVAGRSTANTATVETGALWGQFNRNGSRLYVISERSPYMTVIDPTALQATNRVFIRVPADALKVDAKTDMIYVAGSQRGDVEVYDPLSLVSVESIPAEGAASYLTIDDQENSLLLLSPESRTLTSVNINSRNTVFVIDVGEDPYQVTLMGER